MESTLHCIMIASALCKNALLTNYIPILMKCASSLNTANYWCQLRKVLIVVVSNSSAKNNPTKLIKSLTRITFKGIGDEVIPRRTRTIKYVLAGGLMVLILGEDGIDFPVFSKKIYSWHVQKQVKKAWFRSVFHNQKKSVMTVLFASYRRFVGCVREDNLSHNILSVN